MKTGLDVKALRAEILNRLTFTPKQYGELIRYSNPIQPDLGELLFCEAEDLYAFATVDYTIAQDFTLPFDHREWLLRFGIFQNGKTETTMSGTTQINTASAFLCVEHNIQGVQTWRRGQHFHGTEILLYPEFFKRFIEPIWPGALDMNNFDENVVYHYLPDELLSILEHMSLLANTGRLSRIQLESLLIACVTSLISTLQQGITNPFNNQVASQTISLGSKRTIRLTASDMTAIRAAHEILYIEAEAPPSMSELSERIALGEQKLKLGFMHLYHQTIGQYTNATRMARAAALLTTTDLSIKEIARRSGFNFSGNFTRKFKEVYGITPLTFRRNNASNGGHGRIADYD